MSSSKKAATPSKTPKKPTASVAAPKFGASRTALTAVNAPGAAGIPVSDPTTSFRPSGVTLVASEGSAPSSNPAPAVDAAGASSGTAQPATAGRVLSEIKSSITSNSAGTAGAAGAAAPRRPSASTPARPAAERSDATRKKAASRGPQPAAVPRRSSASVASAGKAKADRPASSTTAPVSAAPRRSGGTRPPGSPARTASPSRPRSRPLETTAPSGAAARTSAGGKAAAVTTPTGATPKADGGTGPTAMAPRRSTVESVGTTPEAAPPVDPAAAAASASASAAPSKVVWQTVRPHNQAALTAEQLEEDVPKVLVGTNSAYIPDNHVRWSHQEQAWKRETSADPVLTYFVSEGRLLHRSQGAEQQPPQPAASTASAAKAATAADGQGALDAAVGSVAPPTDGAAAAADSASVGDQLSLGVPAPAVQELTLEEELALIQEEDSWQHRKLRNFLNFQERNPQTTSSMGRQRDCGLNTEPPVTNSILGSCSQVEIYDAYVVDLDAKRAVAEAKATAEREAKRRGVEKKDDPLPVARPDPAEEQAKQQARQVKHAAHVLERMINQNVQSDVVMDMRYWDDESDALRPKEGTLLPLYRFTFRKAKNKAVTALAWHPDHADYLAAGYGSFEFTYQGGGAIACFSLKNATTPEHQYTIDSGVMCLDFHRKHPHLLAAGLKDGTVCIFDLRSESKEPLARSSMGNMRHADPVWNVVWRPADLQAVISLAAVSTDGYVTLWILHKGKLTHKDLKRLDGLEQVSLDIPIPEPEKKSDDKKDGGKKSAADGDGHKDDSASKSEDAGSELDGILALLDSEPMPLDPELDDPVGGYCMDFQPPGPESKPGQDLYLVGLESGEIVKCNTAISSKYYASYKGHHMPVYTVRWNLLHTRTFLSCGADWALKVWDESKPKKPILDWDLGVAVGDVAWAPYSSTTFAAVTLDGKVHVYDVDKNIMGPMCTQKIARKAKLTKLAFNPRHPIIAVGEEKGVITVLKLSPNLRQIAQEKRPEDEVSTSPKKPGGGLNIAKILGLDKPAVAMSSWVDGEAAAPKLTQAQMEYNKMEAVLKDIEKRGTIRFD